MVKPFFFCPHQIDVIKNPFTNRPLNNGKTFIDQQLEFPFFLTNVRRRRVFDAKRSMELAEGIWQFVAEIRQVFG